MLQSLNAYAALDAIGEHSRVGDQARWPALVGPKDLLKVSASHVDQLARGCGMHGALKVRPQLKSAVWAQRYDNDQPFLLGLIRDLCFTFHGEPRAEEWEGLNDLLNKSLSRFALQPGLQKYIRTAVENYLECHDVIQQDLGPLRLKTCDPVVSVGPNNLLTVWAPVYESDSGTREVRRLRLGSARRSGAEIDPWTVVAAHVASLVRPVGDLRRIRVIEVGMGDGSVEVTFDGTPQEAVANYQSLAVPRILKIISADTYTPGYSCKDCKIAGCCDSIEKLDGFLGQSNPGAGTRSVSARDIETYETCPAQWHLSRSALLPRADTNGPASVRGISVHRLLAEAHSSSSRCTTEDLHDSLGRDANMSEGERFEVEPYLANHTVSCPVEDAVQVIGSEISIYGYDAQADVIVVTKPDMVYLDQNANLVIREIKTTKREIPVDEADAFDQFLAVAWLINLFGSGYRGPLRSEKARLELEVISPTESRVFAWDLGDQGLLRMARKEVLMRARGWHNDTTWEATPGKHCGWCPVQKWCPDAMAGEDSSP
ncbi:PD-(D/E)XK nuclease family protein [Streptomyces virginiae]|uniref:PD-(D/E)XK nuclease family protein n=1 Tax=Streptomyces virginiae TaxID=1961 RepID=A0ABZ1TC68_STRVG|nr:PD-(D/E)XK nuclease family protein [Streptomyces virginiae]